MYRTDVYFLCKGFADLPVFIIFPFVFVSIVYFIIGLNPEWDRYLIACGIVILVANVAASFGMFGNFYLPFRFKIYLVFSFKGFMVSCLANTTQVAMAMAAPLIIPGNLRQKNEKPIND